RPLGLHVPHSTLPERIECRSHRLIPGVVGVRTLPVIDEESPRAIPRLVQGHAEATDPQIPILVLGYPPVLLAPVRAHLGFVSCVIDPPTSSPRVRFELPRTART